MKTRLQTSIIFLLIASSLLSACEFARADTGAVAKSDLPRDTAPVVPAGDSQALLIGNNAFAFDLYHQVHGDGGNLVYSPYSISLAVAMIYGGAGGETASQITATLHFTLPPEQFHPALNALTLDLARRPAQSMKIDRKSPMQLSIANAVWGQREYPFEKAYLDLLSVNYGAGVRLLDFAAAPDAARQQINEWVDQETQGKIADILPPDSLDPTTRMVLANAIYFKAAWKEPFREESTGPEVFTLLDGSQVQVPTMHAYGEISFGSGNGYQAVTLPYKGNLAEMVIILPDQGGFETFESRLDAEQFAAILDGIRPNIVRLSLPKFEFTADLDLKAVLSAMGMPLAFDPDRADFSNITKAERLLVDKALHKAYVLVNESGTEAAAATVMNAVPASLPQEMSVNRPFIFVIRDVSTGTILFVGRVLNPFVPGR